MSGSLFDANPDANHMRVQLFTEVRGESRSLILKLIDGDTQQSLQTHLDPRQGMQLGEELFKQSSQLRLAQNAD